MALPWSTGLRLLRGPASIDLKPQIPASRLKFQPQGSNSSIEAHVLASSLNLNLKDLKLAFQASD